MLRFILALSTSALFASSVFAVSFDSVQYWIGTGSNRAALVIDFNDGQMPRSYMWGYRWNGVATGEDMLKGIVNHDSLLQADFSFFSGFGSALDAVRYLPVGVGGFRHTGVGNATNTRYWSYWSSTNGSATWSFSNIGMSARTLNDGAVDGWSLSDPNYTAFEPTAPVAAVPEPSSLAVLGAGLAWLSRRKRA